MNPFVEECRREWKRLGVADPIANEMAADLAADLDEAEAEGASPEDVLGTAAFDPRAFAAAWAVERGLAPSAFARAPRRLVRSRPAIVAVVFGLVAVAGAVLVLTTGGVRERRFALGVPAMPTLRIARARPVWVGVGAGRLPRLREVRPRVFGIAPAARRTVVRIDVGGSVDRRPVGWLLVLLGVAGTLGAVLYAALAERRYPRLRGV